MSRAEISMAKKERVLALHAKGLTVPVIAERLGCKREYVRSTIYRAGLEINRVAESE